MAKKRLTDKGLENMAVKEGQRLELWDAIVPALVLRVGGRRRSWQVMYRFGSQRRRDRIGTWPALKVSEARKRASERLELAGQGVDPREADRAREREQERQREEAERRAQNTVKSVLGEFMRRYGDGLRTGAKIRQDLEANVIDDWGERPMNEITAEEVIELLDRIRDRPAPILANRVRGHLQLLFKWAKGRRIIAENIMADIPRPAREVRRQRTLDHEEVKAVWTAAEAMGFPFGPYIQLLLLTGQRRGEVVNMEWSELDLDNAVWTIPPEKYKSAKAHLVPLSRQAVEILKAMPRMKKTADEDSPLVFTTNGERPISGMSKYKARLDKASGVTDWRLHDLRRTVRTELSRLRVPYEVAELVIGHTLKGLHAVYDQHGYLDERREALQRWADEIDRIVQGGKVVKFPTRA